MPKRYIEHGDTVKDKITGFKGIATGRATYITGCDHILVAPRVGKDGKRVNAEWFDEARVEIVKKGKAVAASVKPQSALAGG